MDYYEQHGDQFDSMMPTNTTNFISSNSDLSAQSTGTVSPFAGPAALPATSAPWTASPCTMETPQITAYASQPHGSLRAASLPALALHHTCSALTKPVKRRHRNPTMMASSLNSASLPNAQQYANAVNQAAALQVEVCTGWCCFMLTPPYNTQNEVLQTCLRSMLHQLQAKESECRALRAHLANLRS